ncbi:acyl-CoA thioesterase [Allostreptomyces psammosilenae]|uniref:Acyl-CoA thioester hydrolase n=1 Tax=Allostreptomyces psammosilenae TaxID=1892865 RepID=A0A853A2I4_9ACTN|nr:thioesterase family protein [Allostreptomyces psammosilenae]NYI08337.1 acyl-CoA thioester hydrolase [Allostreptomyces psammosilenae]
MSRHVYACPIRWSDMDAFQHVNNVVYLRYLEEARVDFMFTLASREGAKGLASGIVVARHEIDYLRPLVHRPEPVTIETWITRLGNASMSLAYEIKDGDLVYARASSVLVPYDLTEGRPRRLSEEERAFLRGFMSPEPEPEPEREPEPGAAAVPATRGGDGA